MIERLDPEDRMFLDTAVSSIEAKQRELNALIVAFASVGMHIETNDNTDDLRQCTDIPFSEVLMQLAWMAGWACQEIQSESEKIMKRFVNITP